MQDRLATLPAIMSAALLAFDTSTEILSVALQWPGGRQAWDGPGGALASSALLPRVRAMMDRDYFRSIYFRVPVGLLFEIATLSPGFAVDEDPERLGEELRLPAMHQHLREHLERTLTPLDNPRSALAG